MQDREVNGEQGVFQAFPDNPHQQDVEGSRFEKVPEHVHGPINVRVESEGHLAGHRQEKACGQGPSEGSKNRVFRTEDDDGRKDQDGRDSPLGEDFEKGQARFGKIAVGEPAAEDGSQAGDRKQEEDGGKCGEKQAP